MLMSPLLVILLLFSMEISFSKYYFESFATNKEVVILSNIKPKDIEFYCYNKEKGWLKKEIIFYPNGVGYKSEVKEKDCLNKIKIVHNNEIIYYKEFD